MNVRHAEALDNYPYSFRPNGIFNGLGQFLGGFKYFRIKRLLNIENLINMFFGEKEAVARIKGLNIQESEKFIVLVNFNGFYFAFRNFTKNAIIHCFYNTLF